MTCALDTGIITVGDDDIFIAAFCIANSYTLITRNTKDFANIQGLKLLNWIDENEHRVRRN